MSVVRVLDGKSPMREPPAELLRGKRHLTAQEIEILKSNRNTCYLERWNLIYVSEVPGEFDPSLVIQNDFYGYVVMGRIRNALLKFHDLELRVGIYRSVLGFVSLGDDCVVNNVSYLVNYRIANRVMLFNIQEMSCTFHSKFGEGILKEGEPESNRIWIGVGNENNGRGVLPFKDMIPADAWCWSRYRDDRQLMDRFVELTEYGNDGLNNTYGIVEDDVVIKNCTLLKDVRIGANAYIKGAFKLKNITVLSSPQEQSQIGEGVEMVNGIMGYGSRVFYQAIAVRFVIGRNCQLKYGARLLNSILGDNSMVSCCELLNNLIFPFHEQHHNSSFLIAATLMGQSNIASAATIGSNHNSRSPDGELLAGRGFWPGLCSDFKYDSRFASFVLVAKGSYQNELNITYPFSLVANSNTDCTVHIIPAYWFLYNMFAIVRNKYKFVSRDKRVVKVQHIETNPLAPDTMQEIEASVVRIIELTGRYLKLPYETAAKMTEFNPNPKLLDEVRERAAFSKDGEELYHVAKDYLHQNSESKFFLSDDRCQKKYGALICKPAQAYKEYRRIMKYFCVDSLMEWVCECGRETLVPEDLETIRKIPLYKNWVNAGGQIIPQEKLDEMFSLVKERRINTWNEVHAFYDECQKSYCGYKVRYAVYLLERLYSTPITMFGKDMFDDLMRDVAYVSLNMLESSISTRGKDYTDFFRSITFRNKEEKNAVLGELCDNSFLKDLKQSTEAFDSALEKLFRTLIT